MILPFWDTDRNNKTIKKCMRIVNSKFKTVVTFRGGSTMQLEQDTQWSFNVYLLRWVVNVHYKSLYFLIDLKVIIKEKSSEF